MPIFKPNIAGLKDKRDVAGLVNALKTNDARTCVDALKALGDLCDRKAVPAIVDALLKTQDQIDVQIEAALTLGKIGDEGTIDPLIRANELSKARERQLIDHALESDQRRYRPNLYINRISTDEMNLRTAIAKGLAKIGGKRAIEVLCEMLASESGAMESTTKTVIQSALAQAVEKMSVAAVPALCQMLKHSSKEVRRWTADTLGNYDYVQSVDALLRAAYDEREEFLVREAALASLGKVGDARVLPYLEDLASSENRNLVRDAKQSAMLIRARLKANQLPNQ